MDVSRVTLRDANPPPQNLAYHILQHLCSRVEIATIFNVCVYFLHHVAQQRDKNIERDVKTGWIWQYNKSTEKQSHLSVLQAEAAPLPPILPGPSALKTRARAGASAGHDIRERSA